MSFLADNDAVVHGNAGRGGILMIAFVIWISACDGEGSYFGDETLRMNDTCGATLDIIAPLALLTPTVNCSSVAG